MKNQGGNKYEHTYCFLCFIRPYTLRIYIFTYMQIYTFARYFPLINLSNSTPNTHCSIFVLSIHIHIMKKACLIDREVKTDKREVNNENTKVTSDKKDVKIRVDDEHAHDHIFKLKFLQQKSCLLNRAQVQLAQRLI